MFGIERQTGLQDYQWIVYGFIGLVVFLRVYCILRVAKDVSQRTSHFGFQLLSILLIVFLTPIIGLPIYFLIRPVGYDMDNYELRQAMLADSIFCVACGQRNAHNHEFCVYCGSKLKQRCKECKKYYAIDYEYCPFCGAPNIAMTTDDE